MNSWLFPWWSLFKGALSGDLAQDISPVTSWLSPQFEFNFAGNRSIEAEVVADVASYGKQLGLLSEAVLELAGGNSGVALGRLKALTDQIEEVKQQYKERLDQKLKAELDQLKLHDPKALERLLDEYR